MKWPTVKLGDICTFTNGGTPSKDATDFWCGEIPWISSADIVNDAIQQPRHYITAAAVNNSSTNQVPAGTLLVVTRTGVGKVAITDIDLCFSQDITALHLNTNCHSKYIAYAIKSHSSSLIAQARGATIKGITRDVLASLPILLPPLAEQQRIAAILDKAEEIKRKREQAIAKLDELAQSAFDHMFNQNKNLKKLKLIDLVQKKKLLDKNEDTDQTKVWNLTLDQIESDGGDINGFVQVGKSEIGNSTYYFEPPVVLYSKLRPYLNKVVMPEKDGYATTELVPLYCNEELISPIFLLNYLKSKSFVAFANTNSGGAKMPRVMMDKFWSHEIKVPSKLEQKEFEQVYDQIKTQKAIQKNNLITQDLLLSSLQDQAFSTGFNA